MLLIGAGAAAGAAAVGAGVRVVSALDAPAASTPAAATVRRRFHSSMVAPPALTARTSGTGAPAPGLLFATPVTDVSTGMIVDDTGEPVWVDPDGRSLFDLSVQRYRDEPVLTFWAGKFVSGHGEGVATVLDRSYRPVAMVRAGNGLIADMHEFRLTERGTALLTAYPLLQADLSSVGGPRDGWMFGGRVQEVDVATGEVLLDWDAVEHIALEESYEEIASSGGGSGRSSTEAFDPIHLNSIDDDGDALLVSARHTHTVYRIDRTTGRVLWRMGGRRSDFRITEAARFAWQHDARRQGPGRITLFDNHRKTAPGVSAGLLLNVDETARTVGVEQRYATAGHFGFAEGGVQMLPSGNVLVGWGKDTSATEFTAGGAPVFELSGLGSDNYRVRRHAWTATPATPPDLATTSSAAGVVVHTSWNGATEAAAWRIESGPSAASLETTSTVARAGFETSTTIPAAAVVRATALDADGRPLRASRSVEV